MSVPSSYSDATIADFMLATLGDVGTVLGMTDASFEEPIIDTLLAYGEDDIADATDISKLRALARVQAWRTALRNAAARYDFADGTENLKRSQIFAHIQAALASAESDASVFASEDSSYVVGRATVTYANDPYQRVGGP